VASLLGGRGFRGVVKYPGPESLGGVRSCGMMGWIGGWVDDLGFPLSFSFRRLLLVLAW
jgi:hypothetical protein